MSPIVAGAIAPHGGLVIEELCAPEEVDLAAATRGAIRELGRRIEAAAPEALVVVSPHNVHVEDHFAVVLAGEHAGSVDEAGRRVELTRPGDVDLAAGVLASLRAAGLPALGVTFGATKPETATMPMDWGTLIPLWFLPELPTVVVSPSRSRPLDEHVRAGEAIARAAGGGRVPLVASADHSHTHADGGPYHCDRDAAREYDERVVDVVRSNRLTGLLELGELAQRALADSLWQMLVLHGALGAGWRGDLLSYEAPTYFGMLCAVYERRRGAQEAKQAGRRGAHGAEKASGAAVRARAREEHDAAGARTPSP